VASFIGFAPVNNPAITIAVILDSPIGLHQGGQVSAPVFKRIAMQVLEYLHVPHDLDVKGAQRQTLMAATKDSDLTDESPDHVGTPLQDDAATGSTTQAEKTAAKAAKVNDAAPVMAAKAPESKPQSPSETEIAQAAVPPPPTQAGQSAANGTVVLDVDSGVVVPSFLGKPLRSAVEIAQQSGLEINAIGSGVAREQWPAPGSHLPSGQHITVRFAH
jgi:cell division protein FtsI (penicillin-binding protein 3)